MEYVNWIVQYLQNVRIDTWGLTPMALVAPVSLIVLIGMARRFTRPAGPRMEQRDLGGAALITCIIGAAFLWVFAGIGLLNRIFH